MYEKNSLIQQHSYSSATTYGTILSRHSYFMTGTIVFIPVLLIFKGLNKKF